MGVHTYVCAYVEAHVCVGVHTYVCAHVESHVLIGVYICTCSSQRTALSVFLWELSSLSLRQSLSVATGGQVGSAGWPVSPGIYHWSVVSLRAMTGFFVCALRVESQAYAANVVVT